MVDANVVAMKLGELVDRINRVREHCPADPQDLAADRDALTSAVGEEG
jgi:ribosomal protein S15P/S13E